MIPHLLRWLACPECGAAFDLRPFRSPGVGSDAVEEGVLVCRACRSPYPVTGGIPRLLPNAWERHRAFRAEFAADLGRLDLAPPPRGRIQRFERLHRLTARAFGYEWNTYRTTSREEDIVTFFWLTGVDLDVYEKLPVTDVFTFYPTEADVQKLDGSRLAGATVLDVGCGMGKYLAVVSEYAKEVIGLDLSDALLRARRVTANRQNIHLVQGDILAPPLVRDRVDFVYSVGVLHHTPDAHAAFLRAASLVKPGGALAVWLYPTELNTSPYATWVHRIQDDWLRPVACRLPPRALHAVAGLFGRLTFVRDRCAERHAATGSRLAYYAAMAAGAVAVGRHKDPEIAAFLNFDWYSPQYRTYHSEEQLRSWYREAGFRSPRILPQRVSAIGTRSGSE